MRQFTTLLLISIFCICTTKTMARTESGHNQTNTYTNSEKSQKAYAPEKDSYKKKVEAAFTKRIKYVGRQFFNTSGLNPSEKEKDMLKFLYAYMPLADITDYPTSFFLDNIRCSMLAREEMPWGKNIPEILFRHFIIPVRVNNEALDSSRMIIFDELKNRIKHLSMYDAILEVNHWCHEKATYQPSDARTSSPLATIKTATGRCGEQSTLAVAALRAVGIPARQVYTPRWAHTDDNHAWVEAWADGKWYFLGACEPEPVLNLGWFNAPASRAMLMHTKVFGDYNGPEEVMLRSSNYTEINLTTNYALTAPLKITVVDSNNSPISNAQIDFKIYNYAEFFTVATKYTDAQGRAQLSAGLGDMLVWISKDGMYTYRKISFGKDTDVKIQLSQDSSLKQSALPYIDSLDIVPPVGSTSLPYVSDEQRTINQHRLAYEDSLRKAYTATFLNTQQAEAVSKDMAQYIVKSRGNHKTIIDFIHRHEDNPKRVNALLSTLSDKDLRDITTDILEDNYTSESNQLSPRVENEMIISPFKQILAQTFKKKEKTAFINDPSLIAKWIEDNIRTDNDSIALMIAQTPVGAMRAKLTDVRSRDILFVDIARSLGIEARKDPVTSKIQYRRDEAWHDVYYHAPAAQKNAKGKLILDYAPTKYLDNPLYYSHFTISKIIDGRPQLLNLEEGQADMGNGTSWSNTFKNGYSLDTGDYILTSGTRLANGSVLACNKIFTVHKDATTHIDLTMRQSPEDVSVIGSFNSEALIHKDGKEVSILSQTGRGYFVVGLIGVDQEPSNHALHDIEKLKKQFEKWNRPLVLLFENSEKANKFNLNEFKDLPSTAIFAIDKDKRIADEITHQMKLADKNQLPIFIIADTFNRVVFVSQGYTIGLGEQLINVIKKL